MAGIPVLMYHRVSPNRGRKAEKLRVSPEKFGWQMKYLFSRGYRTISASQLLDFCQGERALPKRRIIISFDDGYQDNFLYAFPILKKYEFRAIIFLVTDYIGSDSSWDEKGPEPLLNWAEIEEMRQAGMEFGSHSHAHRLLPSLPEEEIRLEVERSKSVLESKLGESVEFFSYPWGKLSEAVKETVKDCGYRGAFSTLPGKNGVGEDSFALRRILIRGYDTSFHFLLNLKLGRSRV
ncbi:polysaccharide deacetylase family protein [candidate division NPL-UPA2 bacterium]|nr:polysaccharide deacetylase family protein [candidate division NPL-UPA2 bacterium]